MYQMYSASMHLKAYNDIQGKRTEYVHESFSSCLNIYEVHIYSYTRKMIILVRMWFSFVNSFIWIWTFETKCKIAISSKRLVFDRIWKVLFSFVNKGGTTDITVYKLQEDKAITELVATGSEEWGGTNVDEAYRQFLEDIYGNDVLETFNSDPEYFIDDFEYRYYFESKKIESSSFSFNHNTKMRLVTPVVLSEILFKNQRSQRVFHDDLCNVH